MVDNDYLTEQSRAIRNIVLDMIFEAKSPHIGCAFSIVDILTALYFGGILNIDPQNPDWKHRDKFILSKGHACVALYATLALRGYFPLEKLKGYGTDGTFLGDHHSIGALPGIETSNGSLGHGLSLGIGMALAARKAGSSSRTFVLVGDGELQEGSNWEALMFAGFHKLNNLILIIDNNNLEILGSTDKILSLAPIHKKLESFGWSAKNIHGHSFAEIIGQLNIRHKKPFALNCQTTKGKGISFMENDYLWHSKCPTKKEYERAKEELSGRTQ